MNVLPPTVVVVAALGQRDLPGEAYRHETRWMRGGEYAALREQLTALLGTTPTA